MSSLVCTAAMHRDLCVLCHFYRSRTRLFSSMSTHHSAELLTVRDVPHLSSTKQLARPTPRLRPIGDLWRRAVSRGRNGATTLRRRNHDDDDDDDDDLSLLSNPAAAAAAGSRSTAGRPAGREWSAASWSAGAGRESYRRRCCSTRAANRSTDRPAPADVIHFIVVSATRTVPCPGSTFI